MDRLFETQRRLTRLARPIMQRVTNVPIAGESVFGAVRRFYDRLDGVRDLLIDGNVTSARLVVNAERLVVAEARRTYTYLSLFGYHVDAVIANRILPDEVDHPYLAQWKASQGANLAVIEEAFAPLPVLVSELASEEVVGFSALGMFAKRCYGDDDPARRLSFVEPFRVEAEGDTMSLSLQLPFVGRDEVDLSRTDHELVVTVGPYRRLLMLPDSLDRRSVARARFIGDRLVIDFI
jgi:arsenite-transporting ATPase